MRRQKCDRKTPCTRCVQNKEAHLCTTEWTNGYNPAVHRKYPRKVSPPISRPPVGVAANGLAPLDGSQLPQAGTVPWPPSDQRLPIHFRTQAADGQVGSHPSRHRSFSATSSSEGNRGQSQLPTPSSTNVDFITYGRSDYADVSIGTLLQEKDDYTRNQALMDQTLNQSRTKTVLDESPTSSFSPAAQSVEVYHLQSLLPHRDQVLQMVEYHHHCMTYLCGGI